MVKKKAALTLLRLYRKHSDVIPAAEWALRIVAIMDDTDLVGREFIELAFKLSSHLSPGSSPVCYNPGNGARTGPFRAVRSLLSKGRRPTA
jgi:AP-2 complex subunit alpha